MKLYTRYAVAISIFSLSMVSTSIASADPIASCQRYANYKSHLDQRYNVRCDYSLPVSLHNFAINLQYTYVSFTGSVINLPYDHQYFSQRFSYSKEKLRISNTNCSVKVSGFGPQTVIADCPANVRDIGIQVVADISETLTGPGLATPIRSWYTASRSNEIFWSSVSGAGGGTGSGTGGGGNSNGSEMVAGPYWSLSGCVRQCENTHIGVCRRTQGGGPRHYCSAH